MTMKNTKITMREQFKMSKMGSEGFPPCGDMPYLIGKLKDAGLKLEGSILDAGCGQGRFARYIAQSGGIDDVTGVDESEACINLAIERSPGHVVAELSFEQGDVSKFLKKRRKRFHTIAAFNLLEYAEKPEVMIKLLISKVRKDGFLIGSVWTGGALPNARHLWEDIKSFKKQFPGLEIIEMHKPDMKCIVFIHKKVK